MNLKYILKNNLILVSFSFGVIILTLLFGKKNTLASECPYSNFMVVDGKCVNLDPQMRTKKKTQIENSISGLDELTGSSLATYASLLSLVAVGTAGYKFLVRK